MRAFWLLSVGKMRDCNRCRTSPINHLLIDSTLDVYKLLDWSRIRCVMVIKSFRPDITRAFAKVCWAILGIVSIFICAIEARAATVETQQAVLKERVQTFVPTITETRGFRKMNLRRVGSREELRLGPEQLGHGLPHGAIPN
jgi:hypothetical protein